MHYIGVDLHKKTISICVATRDQMTVHFVKRATLKCHRPQDIVGFFEQWRPFKVVVEATCSYEWFFQLIEPLADQCLLAHPGHLRIIAQSTCKTDKLDSKILADFLARDYIPRSHRPTPRERDLRVVVRFRDFLRRRRGQLMVKIRRKFDHYNADRPDLFSSDEGRFYLAEFPLRDVDRLEVDFLIEQKRLVDEQIAQVENHLKQMAKSASPAEKKTRQALASAPQVGLVTLNILLAELGDVSRFSNQRQVAKYAGLDPGIRSSGGKTKQLAITKAGSPLLRTTLVETAWRLINTSLKWNEIFQRLWRNTGSRKKAVVAVARKYLMVLYSLMKNQCLYQENGPKVVSDGPGRGHAVAILG